MRTAVAAAPQADTVNALQRSIKELLGRDSVAVFNRNLSEHGNEDIVILKGFRDGFSIQVREGGEHGRERTYFLNLDCLVARAFIRSNESDHGFPYVVEAALNDQQLNQEAEMRALSGLDRRYRDKAAGARLASTDLSEAAAPRPVANAYGLGVRIFDGYGLDAKCTGIQVPDKSPLDFREGCPKDGIGMTRKELGELVSLRFE